MPKIKAKPVRIPSAKSEDQPATRKMLMLVRDELIHRMDSKFQSMESKFQSMESKFLGMESKFEGRFQSMESKFEGRFQSMESKFEGRFQGIESKFNELRAEFGELRASSSRMELLMEEQNSNNRIVLEGLQALWQRQDRLEKTLSR